MAVTACVFAYMRPHNSMPPKDLRDAVATQSDEALKSSDFNIRMPDVENPTEAIPVPITAEIIKDEKKIITFKEGSTPEERNAEIKKLGGTVLRDYGNVNAVLAVFHSGVPHSKSYGVANDGIRAVVNDEYSLWVQPVDTAPLGSKTPIEQYPARLRGKSVWSRAEICGTLNWGVQWAYAPRAWDRNYTGMGVKIAVVDSGVDLNHPDLRANIAASYSAIGDSAMDDFGHGTHVAGIIAAVTADCKGAIGVAPHAKLYVAKSLDRFGGAELSSIVDGINWAISKKVDVLNLSIAYKATLDAKKTAVLRYAIEAANKAGVTVVCAAGNNSGPTQVPAIYPGCLSVAASDIHNQRASFSNYGKIDFIAPGVDIFSTLPGGAYGRMGGTSMAAPFVTGLAALAIEAGAQGPEQVSAVLMNAAISLGGLGPEFEGAGFIIASRIEGIYVSTASGIVDTIWQGVP